MPSKTIEEKREYRRAWDAKNKDKIKGYKEKYYYANIEKCKEQNAIWHSQNREKHNENMKKYYKTENGRKKYRIQAWKKSGVKHDNFETLHTIFMDTKYCEKCHVELIAGGGFGAHKHLDHCHETGNFRNILCGGCNIKIVHKKKINDNTINESSITISSDGSENDP